MIRDEEMTDNVPSRNSEKPMGPQESDLRLRLRTFPRDAFAWFMLGKHLRTLERYKEAEAALRKAVSINPGPSRFWEELAEALTDLGRIDEAYALIDSIRSGKSGSDGELQKLEKIEQSIDESSSPCVSCEHYTYYGCSKGQSCEALIQWRSRLTKSPKPASS
jgi:tetratricopeptide (TPR) repeat protein